MIYDMYMYGMIWNSVTISAAKNVVIRTEWKPDIVYKAHSTQANYLCTRKPRHFAIWETINELKIIKEYENVKIKYYLLLEQYWGCWLHNRELKFYDNDNIILKIKNSVRAA